MFSAIEKPSDPQCSKLTHHHHHHHDLHQSNSNHLDLSSLPNFSIRDYVFSARSKDIKTNWPFSVKNLQLCLKHGLKDVLPPFQSPDALRNNQSCPTDNFTVHHQAIVNHDNTTENQIPTSSFILDVVDNNGNHEALIDLSDHQVEPETTLTCIDTAITTNSSCSRSRTGTTATTTTSVFQSEIIEDLLPTNNSTEAAIVPRSHKARGSGNKSKCKLIVKFSSQSDRSSAEDIASNSTTTAHSESMASKVCPVCKIFSSTSNTTLNAHIDQCLSVESSTPKWTVADSNKLSSTRHRIKPRKTRLMVDIYATALACTLEDLDRRNGSNWASSGGANSNFPTSDLDDDQEMTHDKSETPAVVPSPSPSPSRSPSVPLNDDHITRHCGAADDVGAVYIDSNGIKLRILSKSDDMIPQAVSKVRDHLRPRKPFKRSKFLSTPRKKKRRGASKFSHYLKLAQTKKLLSSKPPSSSQKQVSGDHGKKDAGDKVERCNLVNRGSAGTTLRQWACSKRTGVAKKFNSKVCHKRNWNISFQDLIIHTPSLARNDEVSSPENEGRACGHMVDVPMPCQLRNERAPDYRMLKPCNSTARSTPLIGSDNSDPATPSIARKLPRSRHSSRSKVSSIRPTPAADSMPDVAVNTSNVRSSSDDDLDIVPWDSEATDLDHSFAANRNHQQHDSPRRSSHELNAGVFEDTMVSEEDSLQYHPRGHEVANNKNNSNDEINVSQMSSKVAVAESVSSSHKSVDSEMNKLGPHSLQYKGPLCDVQLVDGPSFGGGQEMFYGVQLGNGMLVENVNMGEDLHPEVAHGSSSFADVDPIPIPGPPGSFLPSPRDMGGGSEDFQGNSSLTTSRVQSSLDQHDFIDGDSSDSPVSATSTISNSTDSRYNLKHSEALVHSAVHHQSSQDKIRSSFDSSLASESKDRFKANNKMPLSFTDEPCCCQRKERATHNQEHAILNSHESQLLKRRSMGSLNFPGIERQMSCYLAPKTVCSDHMFSASNSGNAVLPVIRSGPPGNQNVLRGPTMSSDGRDSMSPSPSSNSVLRLMGKNLMVVNQESMPAVQPQLPRLQIPMFSGGSDIQQQVHHPNLQRDSSVMFGGHDPYPNGSLRSSEMMYHAFPNQHVPHHRDYDYSSLGGSYSDQRRSRNRPMGPPMPGAPKEVIMIDGDEVDLSQDGGGGPTIPFHGAQSDSHYRPFLMGRQANGVISPVGWPMDASSGHALQQTSQFMATPSSSSRGHLFKCQSSLL